MYFTYVYRFFLHDNKHTYNSLEFKYLYTTLHPELHCSFTLCLVKWLLTVDCLFAKTSTIMGKVHNDNANNNNSNNHRSLSFVFPLALAWALQPSAQTHRELCRVPACLLACSVPCKTNSKDARPQPIMQYNAPPLPGKKCQEQEPKVSEPKMDTQCDD